MNFRLYGLGGENLEKSIHSLVEAFYTANEETEKQNIISQINDLGNETYSIGPDHKGELSLFRIIASKKPNEEWYTI